MPLYVTGTKEWHKTAMSHSTYCYDVQVISSTVFYQKQNNLAYIKTSHAAEVHTNSKFLFVCLQKISNLGFLIHVNPEQ
jgi:hypothetical protein